MSFNLIVRSLWIGTVSIVAGCQQTLYAPTIDPVAVALEAPYPGLMVAAPTIDPTVEYHATPQVWSILREHFVLDHRLDEPRVAQELRWFQNNPGYFDRLGPRIAKYLPYIADQVVEHGMPAEIALLPIIESALDPFAFSPGGAAGLWQFIPTTAQRFELERSWWYDARRDPLQATDAALTYLEKLHRRFDSWHLALAGYNAGEGNVSKALRKASGERDFFALPLPKETRAYVPRLLALAAVVDDPVRHGVDLPRAPHTRQLVPVATHGQLDVSVAAAIAGVGTDDIYKWNPALNQWATPPEGPHRLLVPVELAKHTQTRLDELPAEERLKWHRIVVRPGDTLSGIALSNGSDVRTVMRANALASTKIRVGDALMIPRATADLSNVPSRRTANTVAYHVKRGDSLWTIAREFDVSITTLMRVNHVGPKDVLKVGQAVHVPQPKNTVTRTVRYKVRSGDSLARIAEKFNVGVGDIAQWNALDAARYIQPGQSLTLHVNVLTH